MKIRGKLVVAPPEAKNVPLGQKRKRDHPALTRAALLAQ